ncbi:SDR family NAD(P)-dependent oxidoreductase [Evansella sp. AB-P1]|uniref:SDR family NAD(P)-dependent oxidoreductase n=1 Tax=Evansella sp. AB-P1 TaxID=3037653 RepID=UPI00241C7A29|nr:SDR family NAD(P)-dependent oxidoreductase [Evansella sp. AB-P1]MDG5788497.1 SDR family NAD(P)-dependent oxidoreductase [Evansella sp. AB-P1]
MYSFEGKTVFVTGSSTGIGKATAIAFAQHGADVIIHYNSSVHEAEKVKGEIEKLERRSLLLQGDVSDSQQVNKMVEKIKEEFGTIDVLVNNAGSMVRRSRLEDLDEGLWDQVIEVNLKSVYLVTRATLPLLKKTKGKIINVTSIAASNGGGIDSVAYATSKGGVSTLTKALAKDLVEYHINVNALSPGVISTPFHDRHTSAEKRQNAVKTIPMGREGTPEETVGATLYLASDYAAYVTGQIIEVNGGQLM